MTIFVYAVVVLTAVLPFIFCRTYWVRVLCVLLLGFQSFLHFIFLDSEAHLVKDLATEKNGGQLPTDFQTALQVIRELNQKEEILTGLIFVAFIVLALFPCPRMKNKQQDHNP